VTDISSLNISSDEPEEIVNDDYSLDLDLVDRVVDAVDANDKDALNDCVGELHDADYADLIEQIGYETRRRFVLLMDSEIPPVVLTELEEGIRDEVLSYLSLPALEQAVQELDTDDAVYLLENLDEQKKQRVLGALDHVDRIAVEKSLTYAEGTAGRLMQQEVVAVPSFWTVGQVIDYMRTADDIPEDFYEIFIVDTAHKPMGTIGLSKLLSAPRVTTLEALMEDDFKKISVDQPQADVAYAFNQYHLVSAGVVDESGRLVGVITIDDAMRVLEEEAEEDIKRLGGVGDEDLSDKILDITKRRFPWLAVNLLTAILASFVIAMFDETIQKIVALAVLMPIVASMGGNAGTQTLTIAVRAIATRDLTRTNAMRIITREVAVGFVNGCAFAILIGLLSYLWYGDGQLGLILGIAMIGNMVIAGLSGILIPLGLERAGADPALASGVFVTTVTDVVGFFAFLGLATVLL
jgi:magnesium transporter